jgi:hypothetical protein
MKCDRVGWLTESDAVMDGVFLHRDEVPAHQTGYLRTARSFEDFSVDGTPV